MSRTACVILAAGESTRMKSRVPKVLHRLAGRPMVEHVLASARALAPERTVLVVAPALEAAAGRLGCPGAGVDVAVQETARGTAHAVLASRPFLEGFDGDVVVLS